MGESRLVYYTTRVKSVYVRIAIVFALHPHQTVHLHRIAGLRRKQQYCAIISNSKEWKGGVAKNEASMKGQHSTGVPRRLSDCVEGVQPFVVIRFCSQLLVSKEADWAKTSLPPLPIHDILDLSSTPRIRHTKGWAQRSTRWSPLRSLSMSRPLTLGSPARQDPLPVASSILSNDAGPSSTSGFSVVLPVACGTMTTKCGGAQATSLSSSQ